MFICPKCKSFVDDTLDKCPNCGEPIDKDIHCPACNSVCTLTKRGAICHECGRFISIDELIDDVIESLKDLSEEELEELDEEIDMSLKKETGNYS